MVAAISALNPFSSQVDYEYMRIIMELRKLGITPSGNKMVDAAKLEEAKAELITKIKNKEQEKSRAGLQLQVVNEVYDTQAAQRSEMEEKRLGAMTVSELNRLYFGI